MQMPMDILPVRNANLETGLNLGQSKRHSNADSISFDRHLENALGGQNRPTAYRPLNQTVENPDRPEVEEANISDDDHDEKLAIAVITQIKNDVVVIIEGDKESAAPPTKVDGIPDVEELLALQDGAREESFQDAKINTFEAVFTEAMQETAIPKETNITSEITNTSYTQVVAEQTAKMEEPSYKMAEDTQVKGDVTARMPEINAGFDEQEQNSQFTQNDKPSPLDNDNDHVPKRANDLQNSKPTDAPFEQSIDRSSDETKQNTEASAQTALPLADGIKPEQFTASQQIRQATFETPVTQDNLFEAMVSHLETMKTETQSKMTISLNPEYLGKVALELIMDTAGLQVKISAQDSGVRAMINSQVTALIESLENKGLEVVAVEVAYTGVDNGSFKQHDESHARQGNKSGLHRQTNKVESVSYYNSMHIQPMDYYMEMGVSSVEFSA